MEAEDIDLTMLLKFCLSLEACMWTNHLHIDILTKDVRCVIEQGRLALIQVTISFDSMRIMMSIGEGFADALGYVKLPFGRDALGWWREHRCLFRP